MNTTHCHISFEPSTAPFAPVAILRNSGNLSLHLNVENSPILFGCRTGICGTCLIEILEVRGGELPAPSSDEQEVLDLFAPGRTNVRLACQIAPQVDMMIRPFDEGTVS